MPIQNNAPTRTAAITPRAEICSKRHSTTPITTSTKYPTTLVVGEVMKISFGSKRSQPLT